MFFYKGTYIIYQYLHFSFREDFDGQGVEWVGEFTSIAGGKHEWIEQWPMPKICLKKYFKFFNTYLNARITFYLCLPVLNPVFSLYFHISFSKISTSIETLTMLN